MSNSAKHKTTVHLKTGQSFDVQASLQEVVDVCASASRARISLILPLWYPEGRKVRITNPGNIVAIEGT